ncbi:MAG TPA: hypothetical protein DCY75_09005 [Clostridiales bacterium]|nr:hypothetical protein [Clostridiales bacterium]
MVNRRYIDGDNAKFTRKDLFLVDVEFYTGEKLENVEPRRLFPLSGLTRYIILLDEEGEEQAVIRNLETLIPASRKIVDDCLREYYLIPKIQQIYAANDKFGALKFHVRTDRGICSFSIRNIHADIKVLYGNRVLIRDSNDNRYEIPDYTTMDKESISLLLCYI